MANLGLIGIVHEEAKKDRWGTMARVAATGYTGIEAPEWLLEGDVADNLKRFADLGLKPVTVTALRETLRDDLDGVIRRATALGAPHASCWWAPCDTLEGLKEDAELYNAAGARLAAEGIKLLYHNHDHEYRVEFEGDNAMVWLAKNTDPKAVWFNVDIAWTTYAGKHPAEALRELGPRVPTVHVKDVLAAGESRDDTQFTAVGTGIVDLPASFAAAHEIGAEWFVVEQDRLRNLDAFETITVSYLNLKEAGLV